MAFLLWAFFTHSLCRRSHDETFNSFLTLSKQYQTDFCDFCTI